MTTMPGTWVPSLVDGVDVPGWFPLPKVDGEDGREWISQTLAGLSQLHGGDLIPDPTTRSEYEGVLSAAIEERLADDSDISFAVFPGPHPAAVLCHLNLVTSATLPTWTDLGVVVHPLEAPGLGQGIQCSSRFIDDVTGVEYTSLHAVFDDGKVAVMLSMSESIAPLVSAAMPGFLVFLNALLVTGPGGVLFRSTMVGSDIDSGDGWPFEIAEDLK